MFDLVIEVQVQRLDPRAVLPSQAHGDDAGWDLSCLDEVKVHVGRGTDLRVGVAIAMPVGWFGRIVSRSSTHRKRGLYVQEAIIDAGWRGELFVYVYNPGPSPVVIKQGDRLAQLIFQQVPEVAWTEVHELPSSARGVAGFGSSGR